MKSKNQELRDIYHKRQRLGMQNLRFMMLLFLIGLLLYTFLAYYCILQMQVDTNDLKLQFLLYGVGSLVAWCVAIRMLWNFNRLGRIVFLFLTIVSCYLYRNIFGFYALATDSEVFKYIFLILFVCKCSMILYCSLRLILSPSIRCIWSMDDMFDDEISEMETTTLLSLEQDDVKISPAIEKAQKELKRFASYLAICLYLSVIVIFLFLAVATHFLPMYEESLSAIVYPLFNQCLFSLMLWSIPVIGMYIGKSWSPFLLYVAILGELLRILISYQNYVDVFTTKAIASEIKTVFIIIEIMRYMVLYRCCKKVWNSRIMKQYTRGTFQKKKQ